MKGLKFFSRTNVKGSWNVASFHSPHSLIWSWILAFSRFRGDEARVWPLFYGYRDNHGLQWGFRIPWIGLVLWHRQRPMPYRELYRQIRNEKDLERYRASLPQRPPTSVTVIDGGKSLH